MSMTDPIADLLTRLRNGAKAKKPAIDIPASNLKRAIVKILIEHRYVRDFVEIPDGRQGILRVYLRYSRGDVSVIRGLERISRPGLRQYVDAEAVRRSIYFNRGLSILSTSSGVMTNHDAAQQHIGGELLLRCW